jgi:hypothetical protein
MSRVESETKAEEMPNKPAATQICIRTLADIREALSSPDGNLRGVVFDAIRRAPDRVLQYTDGDGKTIVDDLIETLSCCASHEGWLTAIETLMSFDHPDVDALAMAEFPKKHQAAVLRLFLGALQHKAGQAEQRHFWVKQLLRNDSTDHPRLVGPIVADFDDLDAAAVIRLHILHAKDGSTEAALTQDNFATWVAELQGCFASEAQSRLQTQGLKTFAQLAAQSERLPLSAQAWLLSWGASDAALKQWGMKLAIKVLGNDASDNVATTALTILQGQELGADGYAIVERCVKSTDSALRLAALKALPSSTSETRWLELARHDSCDRIRSYAIERLGNSDEAQAVNFGDLIRAEQHWRPRASAAVQLSRCGQAGIDMAYVLLDEGNDDIRAAALNILVDHGQELEIFQRYAI